MAAAADSKRRFRHISVAGIFFQGGAAATVQAVKRRLEERHGIGHSTVQVEADVCLDHPPITAIRDSGTNS